MSRIDNVIKTSIFFPFFVSVLSALLYAQQAPPPPDMAPDYFPKEWKEYVFKDDGVRFKFPVEAKRMDVVTGNIDPHPAHNYEHQSFMFLQLVVSNWPADTDLEASNNGLNNGRDGMLASIKDREPKILQEDDIKIDGHNGKFIKFETNNGILARVNVFAVKNKLYIAAVYLMKGRRHGVNWENDFEIPAMGFLDSIHVITAGEPEVKN